jgi:hypothetical protein
MCESVSTLHVGVRLCITAIARVLPLPLPLRAWQAEAAQITSCWLQVPSLSCCHFLFLSLLQCAFRDLLHVTQRKRCLGHCPLPNASNATTTTADSTVQPSFVPQLNWPNLCLCCSAGPFGDSK